MASILFFGFVFVLVIVYIVFYNRLVHARQKVREAWSGIDVQLKRRYDLIPNLLSVVREATRHEKSVLETLAQARVKAIEVPDGAVSKQAIAEQGLNQSLRSVFAVAESYPDLKTNTNFLKLQEEISETEDQIAASRHIYNGNVTYFNILLERFPSNMVAQMHGFQKSDLFVFDDMARNPK